MLVFVVTKPYLEPGYPPGNIYKVCRSYEEANEVLNLTKDINGNTNFNIEQHDVI